MVRILSTLADVDFRQLMDVYEETNCNTGKNMYPKLSKNLQLIYAEQDFYGYLQLFFRQSNSQYAVLVEKGRYISALRLEPYQDGFLLNGLETLPEARNKGCAVRLVSGVLDLLRKNGSCILYSHVDKNNIASLRVHQSCGFSIISDEAVYLDGTHQYDSYTLSIIV